MYQINSINAKISTKYPYSESMNIKNMIKFRAIKANECLK